MSLSYFDWPSSPSHSGRGVHHSSPLLARPLTLSVHSLRSLSPSRQAPYAWTLGDGSTISGLELAISGGDGVPPMLPGGVRRVIIPSNAQSNLAYAELARPNKNALQVQDCSTGKGPIPPNAPQASSDMGAGEFQRFKNIYCNANRPYQPDLVMDVKLFGKRS